MAYLNKVEESEYNRLYRIKNKTLLNEQRKAYVLRVRAAGLAAYGGKCACCDEAQPEFLTIDHINGRENGDKTTGHKVWLLLQKLNYPTDNYQLLCFNCNNAKSIYGACPHQK